MRIDKLTLTSLTSLCTIFLLCSPLPRSPTANIEILLAIRREVVRRFPKRDKIPGNMSEWLSARATGIVLTCLSQILTQVGLASRPRRTKRSAERDETRNDPHTVHRCGTENERNARTAFFVVTKEEKQRHNEGKKNSPPYSLSFFFAFSSVFFYFIIVARLLSLNVVLRTFCRYPLEQCVCITMKFRIKDKELQRE